MELLDPRSWKSPSGGITVKKAMASASPIRRVRHLYIEFKSDLERNVRQTRSEKRSGLPLAASPLPLERDLHKCLTRSAISARTSATPT